ncbi:MAG: hypothetical protein BGN85_09410 [Alphaproteobacteria bacterium 64-11]|jgi:hypothetical protein|nr:MAG: hypothetical protein BGN85_09410 [Alphaproteobacteria bacterium 64-11]
MNTSVRKGPKLEITARPDGLFDVTAVRRRDLSPKTGMETLEATHILHVSPSMLVAIISHIERWRQGGGLPACEDAGGAPDERA